MLDKIFEYELLGQTTDTDNPLHDWKTVAIDGVEEMIVEAYVEELGVGTLNQLASLSPASLTEASEIANIYDNLTVTSKSSITTFASMFISNLTAAGYYKLLFERFITFATIQEKTRGNTDEKLSNDDIVKAYSVYLLNILINYIVVKNAKQIRSATDKLQRSTQIKE